MRCNHTLWTIGLAMIAATVQAGQPDVQIEGPSTDPARGVEVYQVTSPYLGSTQPVDVRPPDKFEPGKTYRTLYVLPVGGDRGGQFGDQMLAMRKVDAANKYDLVIVSMNFDSVPWYGAHATDPDKRHAQYIRQVVVPMIESRYPVSTDPNDRLLLGFSKSGWGAVSLMLRDLDFFGAACSWDAPLMMTEQDLKWGSARHFGTPEQAKPYVPLHLVKEHAGELRSSPPRLTIVGSNIFGKHTRQFHERLESLHIPHHYSNDLKVKHHWESGWVAEALALMMGSGELN